MTCSTQTEFIIRCRRLHRLIQEIGSQTSQPFDDHAAENRHPRRKCEHRRGDYCHGYKGVFALF